MRYALYIEDEAFPHVILRSDDFTEMQKEYFRVLALLNPGDKLTIFRYVYGDAV